MKEISKKLNNYAKPEDIQRIPIKNFGKYEHFFIARLILYKRMDNY